MTMTSDNYSLVLETNYEIWREARDYFLEVQGWYLDQLDKSTVSYVKSMVRDIAYTDDWLEKLLLSVLKKRSENGIWPEQKNVYNIYVEYLAWLRSMPEFKRVSYQTNNYEMYKEGMDKK